MSATPRCAWSGKALSVSRSIEVAFPDWALRPRPAVLWVSPENEPRLRAFMARWARYARLFGALQLGLVLAMFLGIFLRVALVSGVALLGSGFTVMALPFATPETVRTVGAQRGQKLARLGGAALIALGLLVTLFWVGHRLR